MNEEDLNNFKEFLLKRQKKTNTIKQYYSFLLNYMDFLTENKLKDNAENAKKYFHEISESKKGGFVSALKEYYFFKESKEVFELQNFMELSK